MDNCEYCGHPVNFHVYSTSTGRPECQVELGDEFHSGYQYKPELEKSKEKICGCFKIRESITVGI